MRIIAGSLGGRTFQSPKGHRTHPMSDKVRGAIFNMLGNIDGLTVLDGFAGSGALSFEAISRGAAHAIAVDRDKNANQAITQNIRELKLIKSVKAIRANVSSWSDNNPGQQFDLVLCDPPYDDTQMATIQKLTKHVTPGGLLMLSWPGQTETPELLTLSVVSQKSYGDAQVIAYRKV